MNLVRIVDTPEPTLYAIKFPEYGVNELDRNFELWNDPEYLKNFFDSNFSELRRYNQFHRHRSGVQDAVKETLRDAERLEDLLLDLAYDVSEEGTGLLQELFRPLDDMETSLYPLQKSKGRLKKNSWIRLYAIRIDEHLYVVTGGAIKLTKRMEEHSQTNNELQKMERVVNYLRSKHLINEAEFKRFELRI